MNFVVDRKSFADVASFSKAVFALCDDAGAEVSAGHRADLATQGAEAVAHVGELGVLGGDTDEPACRLQRVACSVVKVAEHVPLTEVMRAHPTRPGSDLGHRSQRPWEVALVGLRAGGDDARLGEHVVGR